jgi:very-short-patch-repair endonuclease
MHAPVAPEIRRLIDLIDYVEATERDRLKIELDYRSHRGFVATEVELVELPGVSLDCGDEDDPVWLRVDRLAKIAPAEPADRELALWLSLRDDVAVVPTLKVEIATAGLIELELLPAEDAPERLALSDYERREAVEAAFQNWLESAWQPWSEREKPRRDTIKLYNALYMLRQQLEGVSDVPMELVCGIGFASLFRGGQRLRYPLLTMAMELSLDERSHCIEGRPRLEADPGLELDPLDRMGLHGLDQWRATSEKFLSGLDEVALSPFASESFEPVLRQAAALFDPDGLFVPDARPADARKIPSVEQNLQVSNAFAFFQRERRATQLMEDLRRFRASLSDGAEASALPAAVAALLIEPSDTIEEPEYPQFRGISTIPGVTSSDGSGKDLYFPKPFNREQVEVVQRLEVRPGVVVQGPPGTGKTHTIANIISHYLALGKRVLVTSQKAPALRVLRDKLPEAVRPLAVSLLDSDRDGLKQFQDSVDIIAEKLQRLRRHELDRQIADLDHQIDNLHRSLARIDNEVDAIGRMAVSTINLGDETVEPVRAARMVVAEPDLSDWLADQIDAAPEFEPRFSGSDIAALRQARRQVLQDIGYLGIALPKLANLPTLDSLLPIHRDLARAEELRRRIAAGILPDLRVSESEAAERLQTLVQQLEQLDAQCAKVLSSPYAWTTDATRIVRLGEDQEFAAAVERLQPEIGHLLSEGSHFLTRPIGLPFDALDDEKLLEAMQRLSDGKPALGFVGGLFAGKIKAALAQVTLLGEAPRGADEWLEVQRFIDGVKRSRKLAQAWNHLVSLSVGDSVDHDGLGVAKRIRAQQQHLDAIRDLVFRQRHIDTLARDTFVGWTGTVADNPDLVVKLRDVVETHRLKYRLEGAEAVPAKLIAYLSSTDGDIARELQGCCVRALGNPDVAAETFQSEWQALTGRLAHIEGLSEAFQVIDTTCTAIAGSGAPLWAHALRSQPVDGMEDGLTPGDWSKRWQLRQLATWLSRIDRHARLRELGAERIEKEVLLKDAYERSIELRTWLELSRKATDGVKAALAAYADAVRRIGKGTGKRAGRYRREARAASDRAKGALPCWIMPHYRVSESLPADLGLFDVVIVDEASQSTVAALPALLRAKKILIVGDDKQVSPELVGRDQARADELATRHLSAQVADYRSCLREEQSLHDLGKVVFAGGAIMLTEHFRCVAPIIEFSKAQFYGHRLTPLRLPMASERLDPPLIDVFVEEGFRKGDINPPEAEFIVTEIAAIAEDEGMAKRTIGVTTLLGQNQAAHIYKEIEQRLGTEVMERHDIRVGDPTAFQGDERDIMFVSLVAQRADSPLSGNRYEQRFNVALSRARDRTYLVRSVELDQLRPSDQLRRSLLGHFRCPYPAETSDLKDRRDRCESDFEREMFDLLCERGFRVNTQVRVGNFRIDLVVEGENDQRIAIECDGDRYHGPDRWSDDMMRQRILERAGWTVWRCFASRFVRSHQQVIEELADFLSARGIQPVRGDGNWTSRHTNLRVWRPSIENDEEIMVVSDEADSSPISAHAESLGNGVDLFDPMLPTESISSSQRVTESQVQAAIQDLMSDNRVWSNGDLKKALAEILPLSAGDREPAKFRPGEEKWEELVNNALSPSRGNSLHAKGLVKNAGRGLHVLADATLSESGAKAAEPELAMPAAGKIEYRDPTEEIGEEYQVASIAVPDENADKIYQTGYKPILEQMIDEVLEIEAPIYEDILIERIARAHRKERAGRIIQDIVIGAIVGRHPSLSEDGRKVVFHRSMDAMRLVAYRPARSDSRSHRDIPLVELASLAVPLVRKAKTDADILAHFARTFSLARLREPTRKRFQAAIAIARATVERC